MYRLFIRIPNGLDPIAEVFRSHVDSEGSKLVKDATAAVEERRAKDAAKPGRDTGSVAEQKFVNDIIDLHDKYMKYVVECFSNNPLFHRALTEACEGFCQKNVAGTSTAELFASFCDNLLKKVTLLLSWIGLEGSCAGERREEVGRGDRADFGESGEAVGLY